MAYSEGQRFRFLCCPFSFPPVKPSVPKEYLFEVFYIWNDEDHWRSVRAADFVRAAEIAKETIDFPEGLDLFWLCRVSATGDSHDAIVSAPVKGGEADRAAW